MINTKRGYLDTNVSEVHHAPQRTHLQIQRQVRNLEPGELPPVVGEIECVHNSQMLWFADCMDMFLCTSSLQQLCGVLLPSGVFFVALFASRQHHYMELCHYLSPALGVEHARSGGDDSWCGVLDKEKEIQVCVSLTSHTLHIERKGLVTLQLLSCRRETQLSNIVVR